jgi:hypothetical protein
MLKVSARYFFRLRLENKLKKRKFQRKVDVVFCHLFLNSRYAAGLL